MAKKTGLADNPSLAALVEDEEKLADRIARARERAQVQLELVAPVSDPDFLHDIARARNLQQQVVNAAPEIGESEDRRHRAARRPGCAGSATTVFPPSSETMFGVEAAPRVRGEAAGRTVS